jgi:hypothetical protein
MGEFILVDGATDSGESALSWVDMTNTDFGGGWRERYVGFGARWMQR